MENENYKIGNGYVNAKLLGDTAICLHSHCSTRGSHYKCYYDFFKRCNKYREYLDGSLEDIEESEIEKIVEEDLD